MSSSSTTSTRLQRTSATVTASKGSKFSLKLLKRRRAKLQACYPSSAYAHAVTAINFLQSFKRWTLFFSAKAASSSSILSFYCELSQKFTDCIRLVGAVDPLGLALSEGREILEKYFSRALCNDWVCAAFGE